MRSERRRRRPSSTSHDVTPLERSLDRIATDVRELGAGFALVGGLAVTVRAEPRLTRDADLAVAVSDDQAAERLVLELGARGHRADVVVEQEETGRLSTVRLTHREGGTLVSDLLFASCGIEDEIVADADVMRVTDALTLPVATVGHLIAMKLLARDDRHRPADADDLRALREVASGSDWSVAAASIDLIAERGFARDRDLAAALDDLQRHGAY